MLTTTIMHQITNTVEILLKRQTNTDNTKSYVFRSGDNNYCIQNYALPLGNNVNHYDTTSNYQHRRTSPENIRTLITNYQINIYRSLSLSLSVFSSLCYTEISSTSLNYF